MRKQKDWDWSLSPNSTGGYSYEAAQLAVLLDIRDEMKRMNEILHCHNFLEIPQILRVIRRNTTKKKKQKAKPKLKAVA